MVARITAAEAKRLGIECSVDGCSNRRHSHGMCSMHVKRWRRHGDPTVVLITAAGVPRAAIDAAIASDTVDCIDFPFGLSHGYGSLWIDGRQRTACAFVCAAVHGPRPPGMECCHSCEPVNRRCINPRHLRWDTRQGNVNDMMRQGRHWRSR